MQTEILSTDIQTMTIGPLDARLPGPLRIALELDGEIISRCQIETGFCHKGLEFEMESRPWQVVMPFADRLDPEAAIFGELVFAMAVENMCEVEVPKRAQLIRALMCELTRVSSHLRFMTRMAQSVRSETAIHYLLRDRERILDLFELQTGSRFAPNYLCFGGVGYDVSEGFIEKILEVCDLLRIRIKEYNDLFSYNFGFLNRASGTGVLDLNRVYQFSVTGPNARAAGLNFDVRKSFPYCGYDQLDFEILKGSGEYGTTGDVHDRYIVRLKEMSQSLELIKQISDSLKPGEVVADFFKKRVEVPAGEAYTCIESPRGLLGCSVVSVADANPLRVQFNTPSSATLLSAPKILEGQCLEDLALILASLDLSLAEVDK